MMGYGLGMMPIILLALLNHFATHRDFAVPNCSVICLHCSSCHRRRKLFVQTLSPLKFTDRLASHFMCAILGWVSTKVIEIMLLHPFLVSSY